MKPISILNSVLGPVMRGPSSSHTAGSYHIGRLARTLLAADPTSAAFTFDPNGSYARVYQQQGSDLAFAAGLLGWSITDERFPDALTVAADQGLQIDFATGPLPRAEHPNTVDINLASRDGRDLHVVAQSIGGGAVVITRLANRPVRIHGDAYETIVLADLDAEPAVSELLTSDQQVLGHPARHVKGEVVLLHARRRSSLGASAQAQLEAQEGVRAVWTAPPIFFVPAGSPIFSTATEMIGLAQQRGCSLGQIALDYECGLLGLDKRAVLDEVTHRFEIMRAAVERGLAEATPPMQLLQPSAHAVHQAEAQGLVPIGGLHTRTAARALAVMHVNAGGGVVCAAPTAGSAGVIPAVVMTLATDMGLPPERIALSLLAASAVGVIVGARATFAAEVAGCQVEIGAAGAMAAAAVVEAAGGSAQQAADAAAISLQNTMGMVCDLVQGVVEIPCHTRNAIAASSALVCADLIMGGYTNPIPLDETIDAAYAAGRMLPSELRCTALGGLSLAPSALGLPRLR